MLARIEAAGVGPRIPTLAEREKVALLQEIRDGLIESTLSLILI